MNKEPFGDLTQFRKVSFIELFKSYRNHYLLLVFLVSWTLFLAYGLEKFSNHEAIVGIFLFSGFFFVPISLAPFFSKVLFPLIYNLSLILAIIGKILIIFFLGLLNLAIEYIDNHL